MPLIVLSGSFQALAQSKPSSDQQSRIALLIGNDTQSDDDPARNDGNRDVRTIAAQLNRLGFITTLVENAAKPRMTEDIRTFIAKARSGTTALFLFRGAMLRIGQSNILMPADGRGSSEDEAREAGIDLNSVESDLSRRGATIKVIVIDAPRSSLVAESYGISHGSPAALELHDGTLAIINAGAEQARFGAATADVFLPELQRQTAIPNVTLEQAFAKTRNAVAKATAGRQVPTVSSSLTSDFFIDANAPAASSTPSAASPSPSTGRSQEPVRQEPVRNVDFDARSKTTAGPQPGETFRDCEGCPELVVVPPGEYSMGSSESEFEKPAHRVTLAKPFAIGRNEVTFAQWDSCAAAKVCRADIDDHGFGRGDRPVIDVSWDEVQAFLKWLSAKANQTYRLPSEAEWEYAARAGSRSVFFWGTTAGNAKANCEDCSTNPMRATVPVGSFRPNAFGLFDTAGNAAEWVDDCWNASYRGAPSDGSSWRTGQCQMRVLRGGAFANESRAVRSGARFRYDRDVRYYTNGFRVARDVM